MDHFSSSTHRPLSIKLQEIKVCTVIVLTVLMSLVIFEFLPTTMELIIALKLQTDIYPEIRGEK